MTPESHNLLQAYIEGLEDKNHYQMIEIRVLKAENNRYFKRIVQLERGNHAKTSR